MPIRFAIVFLAASVLRADDGVAYGRLEFPAPEGWQRKETGRGLLFWPEGKSLEETDRALFLTRPLPRGEGDIGAWLGRRIQEETSGWEEEGRDGPTTGKTTSGRPMAACAVLLKGEHEGQTLAFYIMYVAVETEAGVQAFRLLAGTDEALEAGRELLSRVVGGLVDAPKVLEVAEAAPPEDVSALAPADGKPFDYLFGHLNLPPDWQWEEEKGRRISCKDRDLFDNEFYFRGKSIEFTDGDWVRFTATAEFHAAAPDAPADALSAWLRQYPTRKDLALDTPDGEELVTTHRDSLELTGGLRGEIEVLEQRRGDRTTAIYVGAVVCSEEASFWIATGRVAWFASWLDDHAEECLAAWKGWVKDVIAVALSARLDGLPPSRPELARALIEDGRFHYSSSTYYASQPYTSAEFAFSAGRDVKLEFREDGTASFSSFFGFSTSDARAYDDPAPGKPYGWVGVSKSEGGYYPFEVRGAEGGPWWLVLKHPSGTAFLTLERSKQGAWRVQGYEDDGK